MKDAGSTLLRLARRLKGQRVRLSVIMASILIYTVLTIGAPLYSAQVVDMLWTSIQAATAQGLPFSITWNNMGSALIRLTVMYVGTSIVEEYYTGRNVIKAYNHEQESLHQAALAAEKNRSVSQKADFLTHCINPVIRLLTRPSHVVITVIAGGAILNGTMSVGLVQAFFQYVNQTAEPLTEGAFMINSLQSALDSVKRTFDFLDSPEERPNPLHPAILEHADGLVSFEHVSFGYGKSNPLMEDISFRAQPGQKIAIVGSTGSGKTTLVNLLMRFYEVDDGTIMVDGVAAAEMTRRSLRQNSDIVLQDTWLFGGTIAENIAYEKPQATREEIVAAAKAAKIDYLIRTMPKGYDTVLDNDAASLSIGQRQLLTIARVFLCDPPILILDEATSSVDTRTEMEICRAIITSC
ncbi:ABC transporter ATP-binding protein [Oscillibacter sp.]|uniref:ABC transporter ATP-binding protein n=1 Tax=Oscillibacter sp. TaxID=1945593 RepID=UPI0028A0904A|nr:ABC transporter ATP-binding protein [Oscillibacter sp.]